MTGGKAYTVIFLGLGIAALLASCSGRKISTSAEDQSLLQRQGTSTQSVPAASSTPSETTQMTEPTIASPPVPSDTALPPPPASPSLPISSRPAATSALPTGSLGDVFFDYDRSALRHEAKSTLEENARWLKSQNGVKVLIEGHCDERGTLAYNLVLGERRAQSVQRYLQELGVPASQIHITSYGKERPFCREHREACWQQNRRAHFGVR